MTNSVTYEVAATYRQTNEGILIPVQLRLGRERPVALEAKIDTGAAFCIFQRQYAEGLGLDVEAGEPRDFRTVTGPFKAFGHDVTLVTLGLELTGCCFFFADEAIRKNVLGRIGWLNKLLVGLDDVANPGVLRALRAA